MAADEIQVEAGDETFWLVEVTSEDYRGMFWDQCCFLFHLPQVGASHKHSNLPADILLLGDPTDFVQVLCEGASWLCR